MIITISGMQIEMPDELASTKTDAMVQCKMGLNYAGAPDTTTARELMLNVDMRHLTVAQVVGYAARSIRIDKQRKLRPSTQAELDTLPSEHTIAPTLPDVDALEAALAALTPAQRDAILNKYIG